MKVSFLVLFAAALPVLVQCQMLKFSQDAAFMMGGNPFAITATCLTGVEKLETQLNGLSSLGNQLTSQSQEDLLAYMQNNVGPLLAAVQQYESSVSGCTVPGLLSNLGQVVTTLNTWTSQPSSASLQLAAMGLALGIENFASTWGQQELLLAATEFAAVVDTVSLA